MTSAGIVGTTGFVGAHILSTLLTLPSISSVHSITRRDLSTTSPKLHPIVSSDSSTWASSLSTITPPPTIFISSLGTTRAAAGGLANQRKIDVDLALSLARAAKEAGVKVFVLISSASASAKSSIPYSQMKGEAEDRIIEMGFDHTVILRPGMIAGNREESRPAEAVIRKVAALAGWFSSGLKDPWAQDADVIAKAAVNSGLMALEGKVQDKVWIMAQKDIIRLGRTEWESGEIA